MIDRMANNRLTTQAATKSGTVLLVIHTNTYFNNLLPIASMFKRSGIYEPILLFVSSYPTIEKDRLTCRSLDIAYLGAGVAVRSPSLLSKMRARLARIFSIISESACAAIIALSSTRLKIRRIIRDQRIALLVFPADNRYDIAIYIRAAHDEGVPVMIAPAFMAAATEWAQAVMDQPVYQAETCVNALAARFFPEWLYEYQGRKLVALPADQIIARKLLRIAPPLPWTLHSGYADAIAVESCAMRDFCVSEGIPEKQIVIAGSIDHDKMTFQLPHREKLRSELYKKYKFNTAHKLILTALPPDQLAGKGRKVCDFSRYQDLVHFWLSTLSQLGTGNVLVSLHPSVLRSSMEYIESLGVKIADEAVSTLIPLSDVYVASISATIQWAIAACIPVINYDVYRYRYPDYQNVRGVLSMEDQAVFKDTVLRLSRDPAYISEIKAFQEASSSYWGA